MERKQNLGKRLAVGARFITITKRMDKERYSNTKRKVTYEILRPGTCRHFTKGKRRYYCRVVHLVEFRTGLYCPMSGPGCWTGRRWYQFSYLVKILEN